ncbi:hypothetical protein V7x_42180 [Crateriforma conspicua]|uniref:3-keto-alpha-glucoside-1,2-lyase/3-keto-2-hydroxy-glucal hydratase domain-containing protein n=1 Tax=Crateriforma conspicua TaxID=2527996 RepID=A0A5C6FPW4_9PLAN|nr:hypothetical protein V7x_42180 [Crateriforma conspicua]
MPRYQMSQRFTSLFLEICVVTFPTLSLLCGLTALAGVGFCFDTPLAAADELNASAESDGIRTLLFEDDFERNESQEQTDELGNGWGTNSDKRAGGNKQVDLGDGTMFIFRHKTADHGVSVTHPAEFKDCQIRLRFRLDNKADDFGIDIADMGFPDVHAGHICKVNFRPQEVEILDFKNGRMKKSYRDAAKAGKATAEQKAAVKEYERKWKHSITLEQWHDAVITIRGNTLSVQLDGKKIGTFTSDGFDHPTKDMIRFSARREARVDDVKVYSLAP